MVIENFYLVWSVVLQYEWNQYQENFKFVVDISFEIGITIDDWTIIGQVMSKGNPSKARALFQFQENRPVWELQTDSQADMFPI